MFQYYSAITYACFFFLCLFVFLIKVWELSDIDRDGMLERDEFAVVGNIQHSLFTFNQCHQLALAMFRICIPYDRLHPQSFRNRF